MQKNIPAGVEHKAIRFDVKSVSEDGFGTFEGMGGCFKDSLQCP